MAEALYDQRADFWSVGCILYEAHFGKPPIVTQSISQLVKWLRNPVIAYSKEIAEESKSFLDGLLKKDPEKRLTWKQIVEHPYVKGNLKALAIEKCSFYYIPLFYLFYYSVYLLDNELK